MKAIQWTGKTIKHLSLHNRRINPGNMGYGLEHFPFILLYIVVLYHCFMTIGEPYATAIEELKASNDSAKYFKTVTPPKELDLASEALSGGIMREDPTAQLELREFDEDGPSLPNPFLPGLIPLLGLLATVLLHVLLQLLQVWSVSVLTFVKYRYANSLETADFVKVVPRSHRGKGVLLRLEKNKSSGYRYFIFQKRKYIAETTDDNQILFRKLRPPTKNAVASYISSAGIQTMKEYNATLDLYGKNHFHIPQPTFLDMYKQQLLEPLTVFQLFSILLWMLDEYWQYSLFTLFMILLCEGLTCVSRLKNLNTLRGMGNENREIAVYRCNKWTKADTESLVPGDIVAIRRELEGGAAVPCDCVLLAGNAVMNEATLTGESIPQMKEACGGQLNTEDLNVNLDMKSGHKVHILFGGTTLMQSEGGESSASCPIPVAPEGGCIGYVLRTGFNASQGKMVRMIEFSSGKVSGSTRDTIGLAFLLLIFALMSSGYVLRRGIEDKGKVTLELVLRCVLIITSVIPAELPMQTTLAVNTALIALLKVAVFCTEPFRISLAGKVDICLFDKTGTLTTDQLTAVGVVTWNPNDKTTDIAEISTPKPMIATSIDASIVLAGCHSLVQVDGKTIGDPVEEAAIRAIDFEYDPVSKRATPKAVKESTKAQLRTWESDVETSRVSVELLHRNHFASKLQRMSVIAKVNDGKGKACYRSLVKGSPEAIRQLLSADDGSCPEWYDQAYQSMARKGMRVLALAYRNVQSGLSQHDIEAKPRSWAESNLTFAGFAAFRCLVRKDSGEVVKKLQDSGHDVTMITGDAMLTAIHVAKEVFITSRPTLILNQDPKTQALSWISAIDDSVVQAYDGENIIKLAKEYDLCVTGRTLLATNDLDDQIWKCLQHIRIYARMTPELKERVLTHLKKNGHHPLMCGDGANDVGALKQADIGVALLSGFGSANATKVDGQETTSKLKKVSAAEAADKKQLMKLHTSVIKKRLAALNINHQHCREKTELVDLLVQHDAKGASTEIAKSPKVDPKEKAKKAAEEKKQLMLKKQEEIEADVRAREARGESMARIRAIAAFAQREANEAREKAKARQGSKGFAAAANQATMQQFMDDFEDGEIPMVKLGDASIASPFTSRAPSIKATIDIIRQGRCALVTSVQMYQILAVNCLISSYSLSVLYLDKVKYGNAQMVALGMISTVASLTLSRSNPLEKLGPVRPLTSIFHPALFFSLVGQFALHLGCMVYSTQLAKQYTPEDDDRHSKPGEFEPNVMSTVVFLVNAVQTVSVCAVNYKGRPFMKSMTDNPGLLYSLGACFVGICLAATEAMPLFNKVVQIVPMPDPHFTKMLVGLLMLDVLGSFLWDQLCVLIFAPHIFFATYREVTSRDLRQVVKMVVVTMVFIYIVSNIDYDEIERQRLLLEEQESAASAAASA